MTSSFNPTEHGFKRLPDKFHHETVLFYELNLGAATTDFDPCRLNIFLSQDGDFVIVWSGLFEPIFAEGMLRVPEGIDLHQQYQQSLFRGHIRSADIGTIIMDALDFKHKYHQGVLRERDGKFVCDTLDDAVWGARAVKAMDSGFVRGKLAARALKELIAQKQSELPEPTPDIFKTIKSI